LGDPALSRRLSSTDALAEALENSVASNIPLTLDWISDPDYGDYGDTP
jgi:hypothetical protein